MNEAKNSVLYLQNIKFSSLGLQEKIEIKTLGRLTPDLNIYQLSQSRACHYQRKFNRGIYMKNHWVTGCPKQNALFCFPCLLFGTDTLWIKTGLTDLDHLNEKVKKHEKSLDHLKSVFNLGMLATVDIRTQLSENCVQETNRHNENVKKNRDILSKIIDCILFCGKFGLPLRGHYETEDSLNPEVFRGLLQFAGTLDEDLKNHFQKSHIFEGSSTTILNELLDSILNVCRSEICNEIKRAKYLAIMADDTTDVSEHTEQVIVFRYELEGTVFERFWGFFNTKIQNTEGLAECLLEQLKIVLGGDHYKLIAQTYDTENGGVHKIIQQMYKNAHFVHCYAHQLNLIMEKAASQNPQARIFFSSLAAIPDFFSKSQSRFDALDGISKLISRWNFNSEAVKTVFDNKEILYKIFKSLEQNSINLATIQEAAGLIRILNDENFNFWLKFFNQIMPHVDILYCKLQNRSTNSVNIFEAVELFTKVIKEIGNNLPSAIEPEDFLSTKRPRFSKKNTDSAANEVCDYIIFQAKERFAFTKHLSAARLFSPFIFSNTNQIPFTELRETLEAYPTLDREKLYTELRVLYSRPEFKNLKGHKNIYDVMYKSGIHESFTEVFSLLQIILTTPMITTEPERCLSAIKRIKTFLRTTVEQNKLTALAMITLENNIIPNIANFNEKVIDDFANQKERQMEFKYK